jgi:hypothetical protein
MSIFQSFLALVKDLPTGDAKPANVLHVSPQDEHQILAAFDELPDPLKAKIMVDGVRAALPRIFGLRVVWDADKTRVEPEKSTTVGFH